MTSGDDRSKTAAILTKALAALRAYEERGERALRVLEQEGAEAFLDAMARRDAAFHDLAALDRLLAHHGVDLAAVDEARAAARRLAAMNAKLADLLDAAKLRLERQHAGALRMRAAVPGFRSQSAPPPRLVKLA